MSLSLPNLSFQASEPRPYLESLPRFENDAEIRTPSQWQENLWLACFPTFSVVETSVSLEAPPLLAVQIGSKHTLLPSALPQSSGKASQWLDERH